MSAMAQTGVHRYQQELTAHPRALAQIRRTVTNHLRLWGHGALEEPVATCLTEMLTNVGKHTGSLACVVTLKATATAVRLAVSDTSRQLPLVKEADWDDESGRGMFLIARTSARWGADVTATGKEVWAEFHTGDAGEEV